MMQVPNEQSKPKKHRGQRFFRGLDLPLITMILAMYGIGMVAVANATPISDDPTGTLFKQMVFDIVALAILVTIYLLPINFRSRGETFGWAGIGISLFLFFIAMFQPAINGAKGWIRLTGVSIQPVEFFKVALVLLFSSYFSSERSFYKQPPVYSAEVQGIVPKLRRFIHDPKFMLRDLLQFVTHVRKGPLLAFFIGEGFLFLFPDMGGILVTTGILAIIALSSGVFRNHLVKVVAIIALIATGYYWILPNFTHLVTSWMQPYQASRLTAYLDPWASADSSGTQIINSYYAMSNGGWFGRGLGDSLQKNGSLPEANTDFIMAIVGEEVGVIGVFVILAILLYIVFRIIYWSFQTKNMNFRLLLIGVAAYLMLQIIINLGGVTGTLPITGITFPFISAGGSSAVSLGMAMGVVLSVIRRIKEDNQEKNEGKE